MATLRISIARHERGYRVLVTADGALVAFHGHTDTQGRGLWVESFGRTMRKVLSEEQITVGDDADAAAREIACRLSLSLLGTPPRPEEVAVTVQGARPVQG